MNVFQKMSVTLAGSNRQVSPRAPIEEDCKKLSRTETIRRLLKASNRPMTSAEITFDLEDSFPNFGSHLVWLLLKYDIEKSRVTAVGGAIRMEPCL